jgi:predicted alpha/beta superfamily hydrolase
MPTASRTLLALIALSAAPTVATGVSAQSPSRVMESPVVPLSIGETFTLRSEVLSETRRINVYLPEGYAGATSARFPVLYMPDGGIQEDFLHVAGLIQVLVGNGTMRPFILVGIENTERRRDLTGPTDREEDRKIAPRVGGSAAFRRFIRDELMPRVRARYRTTDETGVVGESLAGLFVVETFLREPTLFDRYIALDPSLWWNGDRLVKEGAMLLATHPPTGKTIFLSNSSEPTIAGLTERFAALLDSLALPGVHTTYLPLTQETHATIYHPAALKAFRLVLSPAVK